MEFLKKFGCRVILIVILMNIVLHTSVLITTDRVYASEAQQASNTNNTEDNKEPANLVERTISRFIVIGTLGLYVLTGTTTGGADDGPLTIESLFFNHYSNTRLAIFDSDETAGNNEFLDAGLKNSVNNFFNFFTQLAVIAYMMMLVYIGIRILLNAGTDKNAKYKDFLVYWVQGIMILFFFPYVMKYTIMINNAFVKFIDDNKSAIFALGDQVSHPGLTSEGGSLGDISDGMDSAKNTLMGGSDYLATMFQLAFNEGWLVYAICFLIMVKQILTLVVIYFKRVLMTVFLITVFPLVTISYAVDKLGDGKSQAFGNWCKEYMLNVFIQSFHAIVYVIGMALILKLGDGGNISDHWLIVVILISFISKGDDLMKNVFNIKGSSAKTVGNMASTMMATKGAIDVATGTVGAVSKKLGKDSNFGHAMQSANKFKGFAMDNISSRLSASNARAELEFNETQSVDTSHPMYDFSSPVGLTDWAATALSDDVSEKERNDALDNILAEIDRDSEKALNELAEKFADDPERLKELQNMLKVRAAQNAIMVGGMTEVELNQQIEIILERMKGGGRAAQMAAHMVNQNSLDKIKMASEVKFKRPGNGSVEDEFGGFGEFKGKVGVSGGTRKKGDKYSGRFVAGGAAYARKQRMAAGGSMSGAMAAAGAGVSGSVARYSKDGVGTLIKSNSRFSFGGSRATRSASRGRTMRNAMSNPINDTSKLMKLKRQAKKMEQNKEYSSTEYRKLVNEIEVLQRKCNARKNNQSQRYSSKNAGKGSVKTAQKEQMTASYNDSTSSVKEMHERKIVAKGNRKRREETKAVAEKMGLYKPPEKTVSTSSKLKLGKGRAGGSFGGMKNKSAKLNGFGKQIGAVGGTWENGRKSMRVSGVKTVNSLSEVSGGEAQRIHTGPSMQHSKRKPGTQASGPIELTTPINVLAAKKEAKRDNERKQAEVSSMFGEKFGSALKRVVGESSGSTDGNTTRLNVGNFDTNTQSYLRSGKADDSKSKISGMHKVKEEKVLPAERETVIVVNDGSGYKGSKKDKNVISLNSKADYDKAKDMAEEATSGIKDYNMKPKFREATVKLAASVTAINNSSSGDYTVSEMISHIDNVKTIMKSQTPGTQEYDACLKLLAKLEYNFSDYETNLRVQVLNDPSLVSDSDANKKKIVKDSIEHVKKVEQDDILLSLVKHDVSNMSEDYAPIRKKSDKYQTVSRMAKKGFATGSEDDYLQSKMADALEEKRLKDRLQRDQDTITRSTEGMWKAGGEFTVNAGKTFLDVSTAPFEVGVGLVAGGMSSKNAVDSLTATLGGYSLADKMTTSASNYVMSGGSKDGKVDDFVTGSNKNDKGGVEKIVDRVASKAGSYNKSRIENSYAEIAPVVDPVRARREELKNKTKAGDIDSLSERAEKYNNEKNQNTGNENGNS